MDKLKLLGTPNTARDGSVQKWGIKQAFLDPKYRMVGGNIIDLTGDDAQEDGFIDLTRESSSPSSRSKPQPSSLTNGHHEEDTRQSTGRNNRRRNKKSKKIDTQEPVSAEPGTSGGKSLLHRIQPPASETNQASTSSSKNPPKRKRRESVDSTVPAHAEARSPPPKRLKSQTLPLVQANEESSAPKESKKENKSKNKSRQASVDRQAPPASLPEGPIPPAESSSSHKKPPSSRSKKQNRSSQSPIPSTNAQSTSKKRKSTPRARSASITNIPASPALSTSGLFYVDTVPNTENKYIEEEPKSAYRIEVGNLLLPQHVVLESVEEPLQTPGNDVYPPPTPGLSEGSVDVIDDSLRNARRYWQSETAMADMEECRTCGQFHTSKLCIGTSVCFTCGSTAHQARRCPYKISCYRCGVAGHIQADCPVAREDLRSSRDCYLCGSASHGTHLCARNWRIYKYRDADIRDKDIEERIAMKPFVLEGDKSVDEEKYVGVEPWCYNCAMIGHLGDDCLRPRMDDRPLEASAFGISNVLYGPFAPRYRRVADDIYKQLDPSKYIVFGDQLLDESSLALMEQQPPQYEYDTHVPADLPLKPGQAGRQRERERLGRERRGAEENEDEDWFSNRKERPAPSRNDRRDRDRDYDRSRRNPGRDRDYRDDRRRGGDVLYSSRDGYSNGNRRPRSPSMSPPPLPPPSAMYPSSNDMAAGYRMGNHSSSSKQTSGSTGLSIRGAASRPRGDSHAGDYESSRGHGSSKRDRDHGGRSNDSYDRGYRRDDRGYSGGSGGGGRYRGGNGRDRDRYEGSRGGHNNRY